MPSYLIVYEPLTSLLTGTAPTKSSPTVPRSGPDVCHRGKPARMPGRTCALGAQDNGALTVNPQSGVERPCGRPTPHHRVSRRPPCRSGRAPPKRTRSDRSQLLTDHAVVVGIPHEPIGRMIPAHRHNAVPSRFPTRNPAITVVVVACKHFRTFLGAPSSSARRFRRTYQRFHGDTRALTENLL